MSEVQSRPSAPRGRGASRGGRGGFGSRGGARGGNRSYTNGDKLESTSLSAVDDDSEIGLLKKQYGDKVPVIKEMFPDWTDEDIVFALQETNGDLADTIERITEGTVSQWGEVKKKKTDRSRSKVTEPSTISTETTNVSTRGERGRGGFEGSRGGRGRGSDRGRSTRRGTRGGSAAPGGRSTATTKDTNAATTDAKSSVPTEESPAWDVKPNPKVTSTWEQPPTITEGTSETGPSTTATQTQKSGAIPNGGKTWASMFAKPPPVPAVKKPPPNTQQKTEPQKVPEAAEARMEQHEQISAPQTSATALEEQLVQEAPMVVQQDESLAPPKAELTEQNLESLPDTSAPAPTATAASTTASSRDPRSAAASVDPFVGAQSARPPVGGYATSAYKATGGTPGRASSYQRRVLNQQEAVVMPGKHAVDRAAVQFGSLGLNGDTESLDVDDDREDAETRAQPPLHSPGTTHPITALPPAPEQAQEAAQETIPTPRQAPGLPSAASQAFGQPQAGPQSQGSQGSLPYGQFGRYGQQSGQQDQSTGAQKPYDPFGQQSGQSQSQFDGYPSQSQSQSQPQQGAQSHLGGFSSAQNDYSSYYSSEQSRNAYPSYYGSYGQQAQQNQQEAGAAQQRTTSGFGNVPGSDYAASQAQQAQPRYGQPGDAQTSGHTTPNPTLPGTQQPAQNGQPQHAHMPQQHQGQAGGQGYPGYGYPPYGSPYYSAYLQQYGYGGQGYGAPFGKGGMYGQPHQGYGMSQSSYDHSSSPANVGGFGQGSMHGRESGLASGLGDYGRSGSAQPSQTQSHTGAGGFGGMGDVFGRSTSGLSGQNSQYGQQQAGQPDESLKPFGESKTGPGAGPSPSTLNQPGRPGSTVNTPSQPGQGLPPPQSQQGGQQGFGGYPSHMNHSYGSQGGQYGGLGGFGGHGGAGQGHQNSGYGNYGAGFGSQNYYGSGGRGGWGGNYGH